MSRRSVGLDEIRAAWPLTVGHRTRYICLLVCWSGVLVSRETRSIQHEAIAVPRETQAVDHSPRSEEHTSELQSRFDLVCRLLLEKKKNKLSAIATQAT